MNALAKLGIAETPTLADDSHFLREEFLGPAQEHEWSQGNNHRAGLSSNVERAKDIRGGSSMPPKMAGRLRRGQGFLPSHAAAAVPERLGRSLALPDLFWRPFAQKESDCSAIFLLIVIPICPRIQAQRKSGNVAGFYRNRKFVESVLSQLIPRGGTDVAAKFLFLVHFDLTPGPYTERQ